MSRGLLALLLLLAGCVAPEPPPPIRRPVSQRIAEPRRTDLEPAPLANRGLKAPVPEAVINVNGLTKEKSGPLPPL